MSAAATAVQGAVLRSGRRPCWTGTPEIYFTKGIDNSRLMKVEDPQHSREMKQFGIALCCLFLLVMTYAWQHFTAIEYGYKIESLKTQRDGLAEMNRAFRLERLRCAIPNVSIPWPKNLACSRHRPDR